MATIRFNVTVPEALAEHAKTRVKSGIFRDKSDYFGHLIREDKERTELVVNQLIQDGIDSGPSKRTPKQIFAAIDKELDGMQKKVSRKKTKS